MSENSTDVTAVKRALAALADEGSIEWCRTVVSEAIDSIQDVERAAAFADAKGTTVLVRVVERASEVGEITLARQGQRALAAFERFQCAADDPNHFRHGHGMDLLEENKRADR